MSKLLEFIELQQEYLELKKVHAAESEELAYPSESLKKLWSMQHELAKLFKEAIRAAI